MRASFREDIAKGMAIGLVVWAIVWVSKGPPDMSAGRTTLVVIGTTLVAGLLHRLRRVARMKAFDAGLKARAHRQSDQ